MAKDVGVVVKFDDVDYSDEERDLLWGRFIMLLVEAAENQKEKTSAKCVKFPNKKTNKNQQEKNVVGFGV